MHAFNNMKKQENETKHPSHEVSTMDIVYEALNNSVELQASFFHSLATGLLLLQFFLLPQCINTAQLSAYCK